MTAEGWQYPFSWTPDGTTLAIHVDDVGVQVVTMTPERVAGSPLTLVANAGVPRFSPDGRWLAYVSEEAGRSEVFVRGYPATGRQWIVSTQGGTSPVWSADGRELFYRDGPRMMAVEVDTTPTFAPGVPRVLFEGPYEHNPYGGQNFDVAPDGRFLMVRPAPGAAPTQLNVILDWFDELKQKVPGTTGKDSGDRSSV